MCWFVVRCVPRGRSDTAQAIMAFFGFFTVYILRVNLSVVRSLGHRLPEVRRVRTIHRSVHK